jgi:hypothetical protein
MVSGFTDSKIASTRKSLCTQELSEGILSLAGSHIDVPWKRGQNIDPEPEFKILFRNQALIRH